MTRVQCWTELLLNTAVPHAGQLSCEYQRVQTPGVGCLVVGLPIGQQVTTRVLVPLALIGKSGPQPDYVSMACQSR